MDSFSESELNELIARDDVQHLFKALLCNVTPTSKDNVQAYLITVLDHLIKDLRCIKYHTWSIRCLFISKLSGDVFSSHRMSAQNLCAEALLHHYVVGYNLHCVCPVQIETVDGL